jgi:hypothetical protein
MKNVINCPEIGIPGKKSGILSVSMSNGKSSRILIHTMIIYLLILFPLQTLKASDLKLLGDAPIVFIDGTKQAGSVTIYFRNNSKKAITVLLNSKNIINGLTKNTVQGKIRFKISGSEKSLSLLKTVLRPDSVLIVEAEISNFTEAGESWSKLYNDLDTLTTIRIINNSFPFKVTLEAGNPASPEIVIRKDRPVLVVLKNEDAMNYLIDCFLYIPEIGLFLKDSMVLCPGNSSTIADFTIPRYVFTSWLSSQFKDQEKEGRLIVRYRASGSVDYPAPNKITPVKIKLQYFSDESKYWRSNLIILLVLFFGGGTSCILNIWIPNKSKRVELLKQLNDLILKTRSISLNIDSDLRVGVRVERLRLYDMVRSANALNPESLLILDGIKNRIDILALRIDIIQELDNVSHYFEEKEGQTHDTPAKIMDEVKKLLVQATESLKLLNPAEKDLTQASENIKSAEDKLSNMLADDPALTLELSKAVAKLAETYTELEKASQKFREIKVKMIGLFNLLTTENADKFKNQTNIRPEHYHWLSSSIERLKVLLDYIITWDNYPDRQDKMGACEPIFLLDLNYRTWSSLEHARQFRRQFEANVFAAQIEAALKKQEFSINISPTLKPRRNERVLMEILLKNSDLNQSYAKYAKNEFQCEWNFTGVGIEKGWKIAHYFRKDAETSFTIRFQNAKGDSIIFDNGSDFLLIPKFELQRNDEERHHESRMTEFIKFTIAFVIAIIALFSGAKEQIFKLDTVSGMIAVFLLGFGADAIKNYLTKSPKKES